MTSGTLVTTVSLVERFPRGLREIDSCTQAVGSASIVSGGRG